MGGGPHPLFCPPGYAQTGEGHATERGSRERGRAGTGSPPLCPSFPLSHTTATRKGHTQSQKRRGGPPSSPSLHAGATRKRAAAWEWEPACPRLHANPCPPAWVSAQRRRANRGRVEGEWGLPRLCAKRTSKGQTQRWHHPPSTLCAGRHATGDARKPGSHTPPPPGLSAWVAREREAAQARKRCPIPRVCAKGASEPGHAPKPGGGVPPPLCFACKGGTQTGGCRNRRGACRATRNEVRTPLLPWLHPLLT